jgi:2-keto-4-pentenoate hydratase/2-oxohepta-3-ene-1,7-dioic acid hydratase in catechol pathway
MIRRHSLPAVLAALICGALWAAAAAASDKPVLKYARFAVGDKAAYGIVEGEMVRELSGDLFGKWERTDRTYKLSEVKLLVPCKPTHVLALAGNYRSHLGGDDIITTITTTTTVTTNSKTGVTKADSNTVTETRSGNDVPPRFQLVQPFFKSPASLVPHGAPIVLPADSQRVDFEGELVIVIGRKASKVPQEKALDYVLGVTCGNDVSERVWQKGDVQWWRAKAADSFGPCGPFIVSGLNYDDLLLELRVNGETKQKERTRGMIHGVAQTVSVISQYLTLQPGDLIFTGTSGETSPLKPGDVVEVEIEGVGVLRNMVVAEGTAK